MKTIKFLFAVAAIALSSVTANAQFTTGGTQTSGSNSNVQNESAAGYRGIIDAAYSLGVGDNGLDRVEVSTVHGYKFNPYFFAGLGVAAHYYLSDGLDNLALPIFADLRGEYSTGGVTPFVDFRIGYSIDVNEIKGLYVAPSVGLKFRAFNVAIGYSSQTFDFGYGSAASGALTIRLGFDF